MIKSFAAGVGIVVAAYVAVFFAVKAATPQPWQRFYNSYVSFQLPPDWECRQEGTEWVCSPIGDGRKDVIIVMTAKEQGPNDTFAFYENYLRTPVQLERDDAPAEPSTILSVEHIVIGDMNWLVAVHDNALLPNYQSRYYATINKTIAVLLTFSYHRNSVGKYRSMADEVARSLRIVL